MAQLTRDKVFPPLQYKVARPKVVRVIDMEGRTTTSQIKPAVLAAVDRTHTMASARGSAAKRQLSRPVPRSPRPNPTTKPSVGELLRGGSSAVRLQRSLHLLMQAYPNVNGDALLQQLRGAFEERAITAPTTTGGMVDLDKFAEAIQHVFRKHGEPVDRRLITRVFGVLDASQSGMVDYKLLIVTFAKLLPLTAAEKVTILHCLYGDDKEMPLDWTADQEIDLVEYAKQILTQLEGSKQPQMLTTDEVLSASKRSPLVQRALVQCFRPSPCTEQLLSQMQKQAQACCASAAALMLANIDQNKMVLDWPGLKAIWGALRTRIEHTGRCTLPRADFVQELTALQGSATPPNPVAEAERRVTLQKIFAVVDPDNAGIVDARDCCAVLSRGVSHPRWTESANIEARLQFFRSLYEVPVGAAGPNGPALAVDKAHYIHQIERTLDEIRDHRSVVQKCLRELRVETGRLDVGSITKAVAKDSTFAAALASIF
jgi:hypothetical protein